MMLKSSLLRLAACGLALGFAAPAFAQSATHTRLLSSANPSIAGTPVKLTAEVDGLGDGAPTGSVTFTDNGAAIGTATLKAAGAGQATLAAGTFHAEGHTCGLTTASGVKCWGANFNGQLGDGTTKERLTPVSVSGLSDGGAVAISAGLAHSCAVTGNHQVKCWGDNTVGELGDGSMTDSSIPLTVSGLRDVVALSAGIEHTCALTSAGEVFCWGYNRYGQLGDSTTTDRATPVAVSRLDDIVVIAAGGFHTCALNKGGQAFCWGNNSYGQIGNGKIMKHVSVSTPVKVSGLDDAVAIAGGYLHTCALTTAGGVKCWGDNHFGQLGDGTTETRSTPVNVSGLSAGVVAVSMGESHSCALVTPSGVKCWGYNRYGQLGDGTMTNSSTPVNVSGLSNGVVAVAAGGFHSCALNRIGRVKCWGYNRYGQLGDATTTDSLTAAATRDFAGLVRAHAKLLTPPLAAGSHTLGAAYPGDALHKASSATFTQTVQ